MESLKKKTMTAAYWTFGSYAFAQALRFGSNLLLTRLLTPEYFGLMAIVTMFMIGISMFSDLGLSQNIIQSDHSKDQSFLDTAWSVQICRGGLIWLVCLISAYPMSLFYHQDILMWVIPVVGFVSVISSFNSTALDVANKNLSLKTLTLIEIGTQILSLTVIVIWAWIYPSIWALVVGNLFSATVKMVLSHTLFAQARNKFRIDRAHLNQMMGFGTWIFLSTLLGFFVNSSSNLILGKFVSMSQLGVISIAGALATVVVNVYQQVDNRVIFPVLVKLRDLEVHEMRKRIAKIKLAVIGVFLPLLWIMIVFGQQIIDILYDHRYHNGGWVFRLFALGWTPLIISAIGQFYIANGNSKLLMKLVITKFTFYVIALFGGYYLAGTEGLIFAIALYNFAVYFVEGYVQNLYKVWIAAIDIPAFILTGLVTYIGFTVYPLEIFANY